MFRSTSIAILLAAAPGAALAGSPDPAPFQPQVAQPTRAAPAAPFWEGGYVGGQLGYAYGEFSIDPDDFNDDSIIGGLHAGYRWSLGSGWYLGPEVQYDFADVSVTDPDTGDTASFDEILRLKLVAGRELGNGLLYGSAGLAYSEFDGAANFFDGSEGSYVVGLGYDYRIADDWTVGGEYQYHRFDGVGAGGGDVDVNTLHVKAAYHF